MFKNVKKELINILYYNYYILYLIANFMCRYIYFLNFTYVDIYFTLYAGTLILYIFLVK